MTEQPREPAIVLEGVSKRFGGRPVVDNLSLEIPQGTSFGLIGPNGAGKTTTIKMLMGLLRPDPAFFAPASASTARARWGSK